MTGRAVDYSGARPDTALLVAHGIRDALGYVDNAPSRAYLDGLAAAGVRWTFGYETDPRASLGGFAAGQRHADHANAIADGHGYPDVGPLWVCASDGTAGDPNDGGTLIEAYGHGWADVSSRRVFAYGNRYAVDAFNAGARDRRTGALVVDGLGLDGGWLPIPWGGTAARDLLGQDANTPPPIPGTDLNRVWADWWAGAAPLPPPVPPGQSGATMACVGHHWPDGAQPGADDDWYGIDGGVIVHQFGGDRPFGVPAEAGEWLARGAPVTPLSDGDLAVLKRRSGWV